MPQFDPKAIFQSIGIYGTSQAIAAISALLRLPIVIGYIGISDYGKMVALIQILSVPFLFQGAMRLHFRKKFSRQVIDGIASFSQIQRHLLIFSIRKFKYPLLVCLGGGLILANKSFVGDISLSITLTVIMSMLFISILPTAIHYGYWDSKGKQNLVITIDIASSVISVPILLLAVNAKMSISFIVCVFTLTLWLPIFVLMYLSRNQRNKKNTDENQQFEKDLQYLSYLKQSLGASLTLNYNSVLFALQTNPVMVAKINIAEKLLSTIFIPTAALAPIQFVKLTKNSLVHSKKLMHTRKIIMSLNIFLTLLFTIPVVIGAYFLSPYLMNHTDALSVKLISSVAIGYLIYSIYSTLQLINLASIESSNWSLNLGIVLGLLSCLFCYLFSTETQEFTFLFSIGLTYFVGSCVLVHHFFWNKNLT